MKLLSLLPLLFVCACGSGSSNDNADASACPLPPAQPTPPNPPTTPGCFEAQNGAWVEVPCNCDVPLHDTASSTSNVKLTLSANETPSLTGSPDIEIDFDDADQSFFQTWASQSGAGTSFLVTHQGTLTTVRLGTTSVTLNAVALSSCEKETAQARVSSADGKARLDVHVESTNGADSRDASCVAIPHP